MKTNCSWSIMNVLWSVASVAVYILMLKGVVVIRLCCCWKHHNTPGLVGLKSSIFCFPLCFFFAHWNSRGGFSFEQKLWLPFCLFCISLFCTHWWYNPVAVEREEWRCYVHCVYMMILLYPCFVYSTMAKRCSPHSHQQMERKAGRYPEVQAKERDCCRVQRWRCWLHWGPEKRRDVERQRGGYRMGKKRLAEGGKPGKEAVAISEGLIWQREESQERRLLQFQRDWYDRGRRARKGGCCNFRGTDNKLQASEEGYQHSRRRTGCSLLWTADGGCCKVQWGRQNIQICKELMRLVTVPDKYRLNAGCKQVRMLQVQKGRRLLQVANKRCCYSSRQEDIGTSCKQNVNRRGSLLQF